MKKTLILLAVSTVMINSVGCCCCRGMRDWFYQGAYCGPAATTMPAPMYATTPAPMYAAAPAASVPVFQHCTPQPTAPQYALAAPTSVVYADPGCGTPYVTEMGCGTPYMTEMGCGYGDGVMTMPSPEMYPGPAPE